MKLKYHILMTLILIFGLLHQTTAQELKNDPNYSKLIIGEWKSQLVKEDMTITSTTQFKQSGEVRVKAKGKKGNKLISMNIVGVWKIYKGILITTILKTNVPDIIPVGYIATDTILQLDRAIFKYKDEEGIIRTEKKIK